MHFTGTSDGSFRSFARDISPVLAELFPGAGFRIAVAKLLYGLYEKVYVGNALRLLSTL